jgi:predicted alpha/beta-hydrolase family hydrolase
MLLVMTRPLIILAPGASGGADSLRPHVTGLTARGVDAETIQLPRGVAERAVPVYRSAVEQLGQRAPIIGGRSFGGRVASLLAAERTVAGLVLLSYPLHAPGRSETWRARTAHWPQIACPVLLLSGEADPFARLELLRDAVKQLDRSELVTYPRLRHGLDAVLDDVLDRVAAFAATCSP